MQTTQFDPSGLRPAERKTYEAGMKQVRFKLAQARHDKEKQQARQELAKASHPCLAPSMPKRSERMTLHRMVAIRPA